MRIGINTLFLVPGDVGGTEVYLRQILKRMIPDNSEDVFVLFTTVNNQQSLKNDFSAFANVEFVNVPINSAVRPIRIIAEQTLLPLKVWKSKIDLLWSPGYTAPIICSCPQSVTIHDLQYKTHPEDLTNLERVTLDFLVRSACNVCKTIITVSHFSKSEVVKYGFAPENRVHAVQSGIDHGFGETGEKSRPDIPGVPDGSSYILCVAHTYPHKRVHLLVDAFSRISDKIPHHLVLVGKARRGEETLLSSLENAGTDDRIHRLSDLSYEELKALYKNADIFVLPSEYEGFGLPVLEAMAAGVPVVISKNASLPEVGGDYATYVCEDSADGFAQAILGLRAKSLHERERTVESAKAWAMSFNWLESSRRTIEALKAGCS